MTTSASSMKRGVVAVLMVFAFVLQETTSVLAGTTGAITGSVADAATNKAISGARVSVTSPSQSASTTTDATGRFSFISLNPDTYTVAVAAASGYEATSVSGVTVQADQTVTVNLTPQSLKVIGGVTSRAASALVKAGTTADVYSINAVTQDKVSAAGGGGNLNSAWSAISTVPGVFVQNGQVGYIGAAATISIRGGDYDQIGYELDGVPVNRAFDNYPSGPVSSLGQQELQVYTGAPAANAEANGISGYINQVIRTGTAPASRNLTLAIGTPIQYDKIAFEAGGANPARTFSYYLGAGAYNQSYRYYDQYDGASLQSLWGLALAPCPSAAPIGCHGPQGQDYTNGGQATAWALGPYDSFTGFTKKVQDRDTVANFHFGIPRKDGNRDDVQLLFDNNFINNITPNSTNDLGGAAFLNSIGEFPPFCGNAPCYADGYHFTGAPNGTVLPAGFTGGPAFAQPYLFPDSPGGRPFRSQIDPNRPDTFVNNQGIVKAQYQRNFGTNAFLRVYGYTYYSDWLQNAPQSAYLANAGLPVQYLLDSHTRGVSAQFSDQLNAQHLLSVQGSYTTATTMRYNNQGIGTNPVAGLLVDSTNPYSGICYDGTANPATNSGPCAFGTFTPARFTARTAYQGGVTPASTYGNNCGGHPCAYVVTGAGDAAVFNTVVPKFTSASITDQWKPTDRLNVNLGLRYDSFVFQGANTFNSPARQLFYNAYNLVHGTNVVNVTQQTESYGELQPRLGLTYTVNPTTVLRASYGRYAEAPNTAFEQYNYLQPNDVNSLARFGNFGLPTTSMHPVRPMVANNYDFSYEHSFKGDTSVKFTPFLRKTQDQIQQFFLDQRTVFVSGLNVGKQTSEGLELEIDKGDFSRNGLAGRLTFTYTNSYINYSRLGSGLSLVDPINGQIQGYNAYTSFCAANAGDARCQHGAGTPVAAPCYTTGGAAAPACGAGTIANPYWNAPVQALIDPNANFPTFSLFPGGLPGGGGYFTYGAPYVATLIAQYKHGPLAITPALQFSGGSRYGVPLATPGIQPDACGAPLPGSTANDPRYRYGAAGGSPYDATNCALNLSIPNPYTNRFDGIGGFVAPNSILLHTQITYDVNKRITLVGNFANIINRCWGGTKVPFAINQACSYTTPTIEGGGNPLIGNQYNPGWNLQPQSYTPYFPTFPAFPFNMYFEARIKL
ncbi:MAG: TonB-dependent receptor [Candidatus Eremiobacteraeota bacterium]|nr:TonB-dependent receptor [Candidatus Eremiobacteraeota bacterium]